MAKAAKASSKVKPAKKPAKVAKATTAKAAKPAAKPSKAAAPKAKAEAPKAAKPAKTAAAPAPAKVDKKAAGKEKKAAGPSPTIMSGAPQAEGETLAATPAPKKEPKPKVDKAEARKARRAAKDLLAGLEKLADAKAKWEALYAKASDLEAQPYKMSGTYEPRTAIMHKVLGWGYVLSAQNDRLEVLFKDGVKMLISNYKPA